MLKVAGGLTLFYAFNIGYNVYNKETCKVLDFPLTIAVCSLGARAPRRRARARARALSLCATRARER